MMAMRGGCAKVDVRRLRREEGPPGRAESEHQKGGGDLRGREKMKSSFWDSKQQTGTHWEGKRVVCGPPHTLRPTTAHRPGGAPPPNHVVPLDGNVAPRSSAHSFSTA